MIGRGRQSALVWCQAIRRSLERYKAINVFDPATGRLDPVAKRDEHAEAYVLVMLANRLQDALDVDELRHLRKRLPFQDIYTLRTLYEHGDAKAKAAYERKIGGAFWGSRARGGDAPPHIAELDFGEILKGVDEIEAELGGG